MISRVRALSFLFVLAAACSGASSFAQDGTLRERIRERLQQRQPQNARMASERDASSPITKPGRPPKAARAISTPARLIAPASPSRP